MGRRFYCSADSGGHFGPGLFTVRGNPLNLGRDLAEYLGMHSWVFRNRHRLELLYGPRKRVVDPSIKHVEVAAIVSPGHGPSQGPALLAPVVHGVQVAQLDQLEPWPSIERTEAGIVILHPAISGVPRIKRLPTYRRGA